ncbi:hypothetical protein N5C18_10805 [Stenotrophomonas sp. GD03930]|uniref:hypothetical protein n=1 Tax=Stenotrophomonas sp. GD03930 TaxID=2975406 RepID=UPI002446F745|nr:hypothetical protein [Stenotrophomonas sp. GD03930]MDH1232085.1 hypothetical protein [Stenotrophomonas sp. GD03930]
MGEREINEAFRFQMKDGTIKGLGVDSDGNLYWDKKPIELKQRLTFSWWVNAAAILAAIATAVQAVVAVLAYVQSLKL